MKIASVINYLESRFPQDFASEFDDQKIGLIIGDDNIEVNNLLLTLDLNQQVVEEAISKDVNLIIAHHPYIFNPLYKILFNSLEGKVLELMFKHQISLYVIHTNLDVGSGGVNDILAQKLGIRNLKIINNEIAKDNFLRYGDIDIVSLKNLALKIKDNLQVSGVRVAGSLNKKISTIGVIGGGGGSLADIKAAIDHNIDCYITGEVKLNVGQYAVSNDLAIIEVNHGVEKIVFEDLKNDLSFKLDLNDKVFVSDINTDPFEIL